VKRTFCDRCDERCINVTTVMRLATVHHTKDGSFVGEDEYKEVELCKKCTDILKEFMPEAFTLRHHDERPPDEVAMEAPLPIRRHYENRTVEG